MKVTLKFVHTREEKDRTKIVEYSYIHENVIRLEKTETKIIVEMCNDIIYTYENNAEIVIER